MRSPLPALLPAVHFALAACAAGDPHTSAQDAYVLRDSAGVEIVESVRPQWGSEPAWRLAAEPVLEVGLADGRDAMLLLDEVTGVVRLPDGGLVVANAGDNTLRFYDAAGRFVRLAGGTGGGPGELRSLARLATAGGLLYAGAFGTVNVYESTGEFVRSIAGVRASFAGVLDDGALLLLRVMNTGASRPGSERWLEHAAWLRLDAGGRLDTIARLPWEEMALTNGDPGVVLLGAGAHHATGPGFWLHGFSNRFDLAVLAADGTLLRRIRRAAQAALVTAAMRDALFEELITSAEAQREGVSRDQFRAIFDASPAADFLPAHGALRVDPAGNVWVQPVDVPTYARSMLTNRAMPAREAADWDVFDAAGVWLGAVTMPAGFMPYHIEEAFVTGVHYDDFGIERVRVYRLEGRGPGAQR
jgi:hypothetical protein